MNEAAHMPKPFFISIIPHFPGNEEYLADLIRNRYKLTGIEKYAMSFPLHPQGDDIYDKTRIQKETFRRLKALLADENLGTPSADPREKKQVSGTGKRNDTA